MDASFTRQWLAVNSLPLIVLVVLIFYHLIYRCLGACCHQRITPHRVREHQYRRVGEYALLMQVRASGVARAAAGASCRAPRYALRDARLRCFRTGLQGAAAVGSRLIAPPAVAPAATTRCRHRRRHRRRSST